MRNDRSHAAVCAQQRREAELKYARMMEPLRRIAAFIAQTHLVTLEELQSLSREQHVSAARHTAVYVCREVTDASWPMLARFFGRTNSGIRHCYDSAILRAARDSEYSRTVSRLIRDMRSNREGAAA